MAERYRERVGSVVGECDFFAQAERAAHHELDLGLVGVTVAGDRQLDLVGSVFEKRQPARRRRQHRHRARFAEAKSALHVVRDEAALQAHRGRRIPIDNFKQTVVNVFETLAPAQGRWWPDCARHEMGWPGDAAFDHAEAGHHVARVHSNDPPCHPHHPHLLARAIYPRGREPKPLRTAPVPRH